MAYMAAQKTGSLQSPSDRCESVLLCLQWQSLDVNDFRFPGNVVSTSQLWYVVDVDPTSASSHRGWWWRLFRTTDGECKPLKTSHYRHHNVKLWIPGDSRVGLYRLVTMKSFLSGIFFWSASKKHHKAVLSPEAKSTTTIQRAPTEAIRRFWVSGWFFWVNVQPADPWILRSSEWFWWFRYNLMVHPRFSGCLPDRSGSSEPSNYQRHVGMMWPLPRSILMQFGTHSGRSKRSGRSIPIGAAFDDRNEQLSVNHILFLCWRGRISLLIEFKI